MDFSDLQTQILLVLGALSAAVPFARYVAKQTANTTDDEAVERAAKLIHDALSYVPTIEFNRALSVDEKRVLHVSKVVKESK